MHWNTRSSHDLASVNHQQHGHRIAKLPTRINEHSGIACVNDTMKKVEGGRFGAENTSQSNNNISSSCVAGVSHRHRWDQSCHTGLKSIQPLQSPPSRLLGGNGCSQCSCPPTNKSPCVSSSRTVEACLPGLHEKYKDFYPDCGEYHQAQPYRRAVEHDDLYLPASRPLSPVSLDHDDLYLPLARSCAPPTPRPSAWDSSCTPVSTKSCSYYAPPPRSDCFGDIYLPPSKPCTPTVCDDNDIYLPPSPKCSPPPQECFGLGGMATKFNDMPRPAFKPGRSDCSCKPSPNCYQDLRLPPSRPLTPMSVEPIDLYLPPSPTCSQSYSPSPSCSPSRCPSPTSSVYIDEHPAPTSGERYISCKDCLCHKAESTKNLCPTPQTSPCRDCVCHLGPWSPSQHGGAGPPSSLGGNTRCGEGFKTPIKPRAQKPSTCSMPSRPPSPPSNPTKSSCRGVDPRCQSCDCHKKNNSPSRCSLPKPSSPCSMPPRPQCPEPLPSYCFPPPSPPCRLPFAAELLPANGVCYGNPQNIPSPSPCCPPPPSCPPPKPNPCDPRCATCDCHKLNCPPSPPPCGCPPSPPPKSPSCGPCGSGGGGGGGPKNLKFNLPSPRCVDCDCHKTSKQMKCSMQVTAANICPPGCLCRHCQTRISPVDHAGLSNATNMMQQPKLDQRCRQTETPLAPRARYPSYIHQGMGAKVDCPLTRNSENRDLMASSPQRIASGSQNRVTTHGCCCGTCDSIESRSLITSKCAFCEHMHSCCCGMCACPNPSCGSKSPISDPCTCIFLNPKSGSGILRDRPRSSNSTSMPWKPPCNVVSSNTSLPGKGAMRSKSPNFTTKLRFLEPKVRYVGPERTSLYPPIITSSSFS